MPTVHRLGPDAIVTRIGPGGMGEVWRASDTLRRRQVWIYSIDDPHLPSRRQWLDGRFQGPEGDNEGIFVPR